MTNVRRHERKHIKCLIVYRAPNTKYTYDLGLLTDDYTCYQCHFMTKQKVLGVKLWLLVRRMFYRFRFSDVTNVIIVNVGRWEPILVYLRMIQDYVPFNMKFVDELRILRRISQFHRGLIKHVTAKSVKSTDMERIWDKLVQKQFCPWITDQIDLTLRESKPSWSRRNKYVRLGLYYIIIKRHLYAKYQKSYGQRKKHGQLTLEEQQKILAQQNLDIVNNQEKDKGSNETE